MNIKIKQLEIMTRLQTLENRLKRLVELRDDYTKSVKVDSIIKKNPKSGRYMLTILAIKKEIKNLNN